VASQWNMAYIWPILPAMHIQSQVQEPEQELVREHVYGIDGSKPGSVHLVAGGSQCAGEPGADLVK
jgi:hypothetical protein